MHFKMQFIPVMQSWIFYSHYSSLQCHMILQKSLTEKENKVHYKTIEIS